MPDFFPDDNLKMIHSLYLHFPFCKHLCNFCDFYKKLPSRGKEDREQFHHYLQQSMEELKKLMENKGFQFGPLESFYIGGGTPSLWGEEGAEFLGRFMRENNLTLSPSSEFTLEVDPGCWTPGEIGQWQKMGINRFSLGIQSLSESFLKILDRHHSLQDSRETLEYFHREKLNFSADFILGLPHSKEKGRSIEDELSEVMSFGPNHLSLYFLTVKEGYPLFKYLPQDDFLRSEYLAATEFLRKNGFLHYEVSSFARPGFESQHNLKYWTFESMGALGPSAVGLLVDGPQSATRIRGRTQGAGFTLEELGPKEVQLERVYLSLRTRLGLCPQDFFAAEDRSSLLKLLNQWEELGYLEPPLSPDRIRVSDKGYLMLDSLMGDLFREMKSSWA